MRNAFNASQVQELGKTYINHIIQSNFLFFLKNTFTHCAKRLFGNLELVDFMEDSFCTTVLVGGRRQATVEKEQGKGGKGAFAESAVQSELWKRRRAP